MEKLRIAFLGSGSMGGAILSGLLEAGYPKELISATTKSEESALAWREQGISALSIESTPDANALIAGDADLIVLGVKPKQIVEVLEELSGEIGKNAVVISLAAGIELDADIENGNGMAFDEINARAVIEYPMLNLQRCLRKATASK